MVIMPKGEAGASAMAPERDVRMMDREEGKEFRLRAYVTEMMEV